MPACSLDFLAPLNQEARTWDKCDEFVINVKNQAYAPWIYVILVQLTLKGGCLCGN
jgi:hypothetical protein